MSTVKQTGERPAIVNNNLSTLIERDTNYSPVKVELVSEIRMSKTKTKMLGAILLFPEVATEGDKKVNKKHWVSFDNLYTTSKDLFAKFYDNTSLSFVNSCKVGVKNGQPFLA